MEGWRVASKGLRALPRIGRGALVHGCGREGSGALLLPREATVSTGLRVQQLEQQHGPRVHVHGAPPPPRGAEQTRVPAE